MPFISYAQNFEDVMIWRALQTVKNGFYVDVGAQDPVNDSVTLAFYERGWSGINIEASPTYADKLKSSRPHDINVQAFAADESGGAIKFFHIPGSGLSTYDPETAQRHRMAGWTVEECSVPAVTLNDLLAAHPSKEIHFLKVDAEGAESAVLRGIDLVKYRPWILVVEATLPNSQVCSHQFWEPQVLAADYKFCYFDGLNRFYVPHERFEHLAPLLSVPPNVFDDYVLAIEVNLRAASMEEAKRVSLFMEQMHTLRDEVSALSSLASSLDAQLVWVKDESLSAAANWCNHLKFACEKFSAVSVRLSQEGGEYLQQQQQAVTQGLRKHFGKKRLTLQDAEPRYHFIKRFFRSVFRRQGSVNKALLAALKQQLLWNETMEQRTHEIEQALIKLAGSPGSAPQASSSEHPPR
jgi:FkbM family methyltransferase